MAAMFTLLAVTMLALTTAYDYNKYKNDWQSRFKAGKFGDKFAKAVNSLSDVRDSNSLNRGGFAKHLCRFSVFKKIILDKGWTNSDKWQQEVEKCRDVCGWQLRLKSGRIVKSWINADKCDAGSSCVGPVEPPCERYACKRYFMCEPTTPEPTTPEPTTPEPTTPEPTGAPTTEAVTQATTATTAGPIVF